MLSEQEAINKFRKDDFCFFVGAGISRDTGLPLGAELGTKILVALGLPHSEASALSERYHLERMLFLLRNFLGETIYDVYSALDSSDYGENHSILAQFHEKRGIPLLTTNQDLLIEAAATSPRIRSTYIKIHGTLGDLTTLRVTLDRVSSLDDATLQRLRTTVGSRIVIVIGYSFSDFDLKPFFESVSSQVYYLDYQGKGNDFLKSQLWCNEPQRYESQRFASSAESFLRSFGKTYGIATARRARVGHQQITTSLIDDRIQAWADHYKPYLREMATSYLYQGVWEGTRTRSVMASIAGNPSVPSNVRALAYAEASRAAEATASYRQQFQFIRQLSALDGLENAIGQFLRHIFLAAYYHIRDNPFLWIVALWHFSRANRLYPRVLASQARSEHRFIYENYKRTVDHGLASSLEKIGRVALGKVTRKKAHSILFPYLDQGVPLDLDFLCEVYFIHAKLRIQEEDIAEAEQYYSRALECAQWIRKNHSMDQALRGLAKVSAMQSRFDDALSYLDKSLSFADKTHEPTLVGRNLLTRSWILRKMGDGTMAKRMFRQGMRVFVKHRGVVGGRIDAFIYSNLGR